METSLSTLAADYHTYVPIFMEILVNIVLILWADELLPAEKAVWSLDFNVLKNLFRKKDTFVQEVFVWMNNGHLDMGFNQILDIVCKFETLTLYNWGIWWEIIYKNKKRCIFKTF